MATARTVDFSPTCTATTCIPRPPRVYRHTGGLTQPRILNPLGGANATSGDFLEIASGTFLENDFVFIVNTVATAQATIDFCDVQDTTQALAGIALEATTAAATGTRYPKVMVIDTEQEYLMNIYHATEANTTKAMAKGLIGYSCNLGHATFAFGTDATFKTQGTLYVPVLDIAVHDTERVTIVGVPDLPDVSSTDTGVPVIVRFLNAIVDVSTGHAYRGLQFP